MYDGGWKDKAADGYGVMKWQNGDRLETIILGLRSFQINEHLGKMDMMDMMDME